MTLIVTFVCSHTNVAKLQMNNVGVLQTKLQKHFKVPFWMLEKIIASPLKIISFQDHPAIIDDHFLSNKVSVIQADISNSSRH